MVQAHSFWGERIGSSVVDIGIRSSYFPALCMLNPISVVGAVNISPSLWCIILWLSLNVMSQGRIGLVFCSFLGTLEYSQLRHP